jgi:DNA (cytosine-5)-methyltransferase 1
VSPGIVVDLFAGGGGASVGMEAVLGHVDVAINHDKTALAVHAVNHPNTEHMTVDVFKARPTEVARGRHVMLLWASPDCTHFSAAKGGKPRSQKIRSLAWAVINWAEQVAPDVIMLENVAEFEGWGPLDALGYPIKAKMGKTFRRWKARLERCGYVVDHRVIDSSLYGAPTRRRRLFLIARRDGHQIVWPAFTHGPGTQLPFHTAAECIDWSLECPSIFGRCACPRKPSKRKSSTGVCRKCGQRRGPLAEKTLWRIAQGIRRFVLENGSPFVVKVNHGGREARGENLELPLTTVTAARRGHGLVVPTLVQTGYGEREGQRPRYLDIHQPLGTAVAGGQKHALCAAFLARHFGDPKRTDGGGGVVLGSDLGEPMRTVTARDHHSLAAATLVKLRGTNNGATHTSSAIDDPAPTITAGGDRGGVHLAQVLAFLAVYYGEERGGQSLLEPMRTLTTKHRMGLVTVDGVDHQIVDIGFRMLQPHELLRAQFGRFASSYDISKARTKTKKVRLIGNSVPPEVVEQLVAANVPEALRRAA